MLTNILTSLKALLLSHHGLKNEIHYTQVALFHLTSLCIIPDKISNDISLNGGRQNSSFGHHTASGERTFGRLDHLHLRPRNGYRF